MIFVFLIILRKTTVKKQKYYEIKFQKVNSIVSHSHIVLFQRKNIEGWPMVYVSSNVIDLCGFTSEEFLNQRASYSGMIHPEDRKRVESEFLDGINDNSKSEFAYKPYRIISKEGNIKWVANTTEIIKDEKGKVIYYDGIVQDITERIKKDEELSKLSKAVYQSGNLLIITDPGGNIEYINPAFTAVTGYSREDIIGQNPRILQSGKHLPEFYEEIWSVILTGRTWKGEIINKKKNGDLYWEKATISPVINPEGLITHFIAIKDDISEQKQMEEDLRLAKKLAEEASLAKSEFLANMSHELRTPLNGIMGFSQVLAGQITEHLNEEQLSYFKIINDSSHHLLEMVGDILDLAKIESGKLNMNMKLFDIGSMLEKAPGIIKTILEEKNLKIDINIQPGLGSYYGDEIKLKQVIFNLLSNAVKFIEYGKKIGIKALKESSLIKVIIWDEGCGIPEKDLDIIFDAFEQVKGGKYSQEKGTGLGLAISKRLVELHEGTLSVISKTGEGSRFTITLPVQSTG